MKILFCASEASPLVKVGGLADVVGSLPRALHALGHDVRIIMPRYGDLARDAVSLVLEYLSVPVASRTEVFAVRQTTLPNNAVPVYLVESGTYFGERTIYYGRDLERYLFFSRAVVNVLTRLDWQPDIVHCHDWHTALAVMWLKKLARPYRTVFTIHNLAYQGPFDDYFLNYARLKEDWDNPPPGAHRPPLNFMSQGILWADLVTTVSETYAREIVTPECGLGLDDLLRHRRDDLRGIVNGIDYRDFDPLTDGSLPARYDAGSIELRTANKAALQCRYGLPEDIEIPVIGMVQRLDEQKGFDIFTGAAEAIFKDTDAQVILLGGGREKYETMLRELAGRYPDRIAVQTGFDDPLARLIYGSSDMFLMPSRFEPCGLGQLIAMRYGAIPVVRRTGGLADTVPPLTPDLTAGNGFVFHDYTPEALLGAVRQAVQAYRNRPAWQQAVRRIMKLDFSWQASAVKYEAAYRRLLTAGRG